VPIDFLTARLTHAVVQAIPDDLSVLRNHEGRAVGLAEMRRGFREEYHSFDSCKLQIQCNSAWNGYSSGGLGDAVKCLLPKLSNKLSCGAGLGTPLHASYQHRGVSSTLELATLCSFGI
jgi:hypothetical protein